MIERALANYRSWQTESPLLGLPQIVTEIFNGSAHRVFKVSAESPGGRVYFALRFPTAQKLALATPFRIEYPLTQRAGDEGLAPRVVYCSIADELLVTQFISGTDRPTAPQLGQLLNRIHTLTTASDELDLRERIDHYADTALGRGVPRREIIDPSLPWITTAIECLAEGPKTLCHNDLGPGNVLVTGDIAPRALAIDWEYAAMGSPYFDLAATIACWPELPEQAITESAMPNGCSMVLLSAAKALYAAIEWNWYQASGVTPPDRLQKPNIDGLMDELA